MRIFVRTDPQGAIVSVMKVAFMADSLDHPFADLAPGDAVTEVPPTPDLETLECHEIGEQFALVAATQTLARKTTP